MHMSAAVIWLGAQLIVPVSEQLPNLNVEPSCKGAAAASVGMADAQGYTACINEENEARQQLAASWQSFPAPVRARCASEASGQGLASYVEMLVCIQIATGGNMQPTGLKGARKKQ